MYHNFFDLLGQVALFLPALIFALTFRGFFRALAARFVGDDTGAMLGFLTLNPAAHIDALGIVVFVGVLFIFGGLFPGAISQALLLIFLIIAGVRWSHEVPVNESRFYSLRLGSVLVALAGPFGNFFLVLILMYLMKYSQLLSLPLHVNKSLLEVLAATIEVSSFFGVLHLIPLPPFDGGALIRNLMPTRFQGAVVWIEANSLYIFLGLLLLGNSFFLFLNTAAFYIKLFLFYLVI